MFSRAVAEHGLAFILAFNRELPTHMGQRAGKVWQRAERYRTLKGQTLCVIGLGAIGEELAGLAKALDMRILAINRTQRATVAERVWPLSEAYLALRQSDHVVMTIAAPPQGTPFFTREHFAAMRPGAYFYNLARGSVVEEAALIEALQAGKIAGAGLDVFANEPLPASSPLWEMPNVLITPHAGGRFWGESDMLVGLFLENLQRYKQSQPLRNVVIGKDV
jgi:phosphoglycerate dehydrogenase-like enzyme